MYIRFLKDYNDMLIKKWISTNSQKCKCNSSIKNDSGNDEANYRRPRILSNLCKVHEKCMFGKMTEYFDDILEKCHYGFRNVY